jgi:voltage-dependent potassium channel beta subunit
MKYRQLGKSGLFLSEISLGSWLTIGMGIDEKRAFDCLDQALNEGINFIDTADVYHRGESEKAIGIYLKKINRRQVILGTKVFGPMSEHLMDQGLSYRHILNGCQESLERLQTDYIDLYQCHRYDIDTPLEETCSAMQHLIEKGWIHYWGVSQWSAVQITNAVRICERYGWRKPVSNQPIYNLLNRSLEVDVMSVCEEEGLGLVVYSPLAQGILSGKYKDPQNFPADSRAANEKMNKMFPFKRLNEENLQKIAKLEAIAQELGATMSQLALAWCLRKKPVTSTITGASQSAQVIENAKSIGVELPPEILERIESLLDNHPLDQYTGYKIGHGILKRGY